MPSCFAISGSEKERQNFVATRSTWRYSTPSAGFSDFAFAADGQRPIINFHLDLILFHSGKLSAN